MQRNKLRHKQTRWHHLLIRKCKDQQGESLSEVLVAVLISTLALVLFAVAITTSTNTVTKSKTYMKEYMDQENAMSVAVPEHAPTGSVVFQDPLTNHPIKLYDGADQQIEVVYSVNPKQETTPIVRYEKTQGE